MRMAGSDLRYGIVGCAGMGDTHAEAVEATDGTTLVACADIDDENARSFANDHGTAWYTDSAEMAVDADLDLVSVCTPNGTHLEIVTDLAEAGVDILCEKPLEITPERVDRLIDVCGREGVVLGCILQRRTLGGARLARDAVADGRLGDLIFGDVQVKWHRKQSYYTDTAWHGTTDFDGGILFTQALHGIDLLQWATGGIDRIAAELDTLHHDIEVPDTAVASVEFTDGGYGQITASTAVYPQQPISLRLHGTQGSIRWHEDKSDREETDREDKPEREDELEEFETMDGSDATPESFHLGTGIPGQVRDFVAAVREGRDPMVPPEEARKALAVAFAAQKAARCGEWVDITGIRPVA